MIRGKKTFVWFLCLFVATVFLATSQAQARKNVINCTVDEEVIVRMVPPEFGDSGMWKVNFGYEEREERFVGGLALPDWETLVIGEATAKRDDLLDPFADPENVSLIMVKLNHRGRTIWSKTYNPEGLKKIITILHRDDGYLVVGNVEPKDEPSHIWFGQFDQKGELISESTLKEKDAHLSASDIVPYPEDAPGNRQKAAWVLGAQYKHTRSHFPRHSRLYMLDKELLPQSHRAFVTGTENNINSLTLSTETNSILVAGYAIGNDERRNGWILNLGGSGNIRWQKQYPRGAGSELTSVDAYRGDTLLAAGVAIPLGEDGTDAAWLLRIDMNSGEAEWQRYFAGNMHYSVQDIRVNEDGVISLMVNSMADKKSPQVDFVRLLNVSSSGFLLRHDAYYNAEGAKSAKLLSGTRGEHIIVGEALVPFLKDNPDPNAGPEDEKIPDRSLEGWVIVGRKAQQYNDPCLTLKKR